MNKKEEPRRPPPSRVGNFWKVGRDPGSPAFWFGAAAIVVLLCHRDSRLQIMTDSILILNLASPFPQLALRT